MYTRYYDTYPAKQSSSRPAKQQQESADALTEAQSLPLNEGGSSEPEEIKKPQEAAVQLADTTEVASLLPFKGGIGDMKLDDLLLIAVLLLIVSESKDDFIMPLILGYLLLGGIF